MDYDTVAMVSNLKSLVILLQLCYKPESIYNSQIQQRGVGNVYLLLLSSWKVNIAENLIAVMGL